MAILVAGAFCLYGCGKKYDPVPPPKTKFNPSPQSKHLVSLYTKGGIPANIQARVQYGISNKKCIPVDYGRALGGVTLSYPVMVDVYPVQVSESEIEVVVSQDKILPKDYWGQGVCRWKIIAVAFFLGENLQQEITFTGDLVVGNGESTWGCWYTRESDTRDCIGLAKKISKSYYSEPDVSRINNFNGRIFTVKSRRAY